MSTPAVAANFPVDSPDDSAKRRKMAEDFLTRLDEVAGEFTFQIFADAKPKPTPDPLARARHGTLGECWQFLDAANKAGAGIFVTVQETDGSGRRKVENVTRIRAIFQEADRSDTPGLPVEPNIIVETSPGKHHRYVLVEGAPLDEFEPVQQRLVDDYGSDPNARDRARVLRLPGFYHVKDPRRPHLVRVVHESGTPPLPWAKVQRIFPPVESKPLVRDYLATDGGELIRPAEVMSALECLDPNLGYEDWVKVGMALHSTEGGREAFEMWDQWSSRGEDYRPGECAYRWGTFGQNNSRRVSIRTLFAMAYRTGWNGRISTSSEVLPLVDTQRRRMLLHFSDRHGVVMVNGKAAIAYRETDQNIGRWTTRFSSVGDMATHLKPVKVPEVVATKNGPEIEEKPLLPIWMEARFRKTYQQLVFKPEAGLVAGQDRLSDGSVLNLYQGLGVAPKEGDCEPILRHIWEVWCGEAQGVFEYVINWLARMFQRPGERGHTVIVLRSGEGSGKNIIIDVLVRAFGEHAFVAVKPEELTGRFNDHLATSVLVFANEAVWGGDKSQEGALKSLVTDEDLPVERKYLPKYRLRNCAHVVMASNGDWVAPIGLDDRRFVVLDVDERRKGDTLYFSELAQHIQGGGEAAFIHYLLARDITGFNPRVLPDQGIRQHTKFEAKIRTADSVTQWWMSCLIDGAVAGHREEEDPFSGRITRKAVDIARGWDERELLIPVGDLYAAYQEWATGARRHVEHPISVGRKLKALSGISRTRPGSGTERPRFYRLPPLGGCRRAFEAAIRQPVEWD